MNDMYTIKFGHRGHEASNGRKKKQFKDGTKESNYILATRHKWPETEP